MADTQTTIDGDTILMAVNEGDAPVTLMYDSRTYRLEPGRGIPMPFAAVALWFGDPRANESVQALRDQRGLVAFVPDRETEVRRLRAKYDNQLGDERKITNTPSVAIYSIPENERIYTVLDDPQGERVIEVSTTRQEQTDLLGMIARQQKQIELLMAAVTQNAGQNRGLTPTAPGSSGAEADRDIAPEETDESQQQPTTMTAPPIPGVPSQPAPPVPDELLSQMQTEFPQDGGPSADPSNPPEPATDLPEDTEGFETPPSDTPPAKPEG